MKAKIAFDFYHDGINPTHYEPGDELPADVAVDSEWVEESAPIIVPGDELPADVKKKKGK